MNAGRALRLLLVAASAACAADATGASPYANILIAPDSVTVLEDDSLILGAIYLDSAGAALPMPPIIWAVRDTSIVRVHGATLMFVRPGNTTVVALAAGKAREVEVNAGVRFATWATGDIYPGNWCGVTTRGRVYCWGADTLTPLVLPGISSAAQISLGDGHACVVATDQRGFCWGQNFSGQLGTGAAASGGPYPPAEVAGGLRFTRIVTSSAHSCGLTVVGEAWCWGAGSRGQLGNGTFNRQLQPGAVVGGHIFSDLAVAEYFTCGVVTNGGVWCWGDYSGLGNGTATGKSALPVQISSTRAFTSVTAGAGHACAVATDGTGWCWGINDLGQLGVVTPVACSPSMCALTPVALPLGALRTLSASASSTCGLLTTGIVFCWGNRHLGVLPPTPVPFGTNFTELGPNGVTGAVQCGRITDGNVWCWGGVFGAGQRVVNQP